MPPQLAIEMTGDETKLFKSFQKIIAQQAKMAGGLDKIKGKAGGAEKAMDKASKKSKFSAGSAVRFAGSLGAITSAAGAAAVALKLLNSLASETNRIADEAAARQAGARGGLGQLGQIGNSPAETAKLAQQARQIFAKGGATDLDGAARLLFSLKSAGAGSDADIDLFTKLGSTGLVADPGGFAGGAKALQTSIGGAEAGSIREILSKAFVASASSPATAPRLLEAAAKGGGSASALGFSDEALLAGTAITATSTGTAERGGTQMAGLLRSLEKLDSSQGLRGSLEGTIKAITAQGLDSAGLLGLLKDSEAIAGFRTLEKKVGQLGTLSAAIGAGAETDVVGQKLGFAAGIPEVRASGVAMRERASRQLTEQSAGVAASIADAQQDALAARVRREGGSDFDVWSRNAISTASRGRGIYGGILRGIVGALGSDEFTDAEFAETAGGLQGQENLKAMAALSIAAENMNRAANRFSGGPTLVRPNDDR